MVIELWAGIFISLVLIVQAYICGKHDGKIQAKLKFDSIDHCASCMNEYEFNESVGLPF